MSESIDIVQLHDALLRGKIQWQRHALEQMLKRAISREVVCGVITHGKRIEDYPGDWPLPGALFFGWDEERPVHVVVAFDREAQIVYIITAYEPTLQYFESDFRTRRK